MLSHQDIEQIEKVVTMIASSRLVEVQITAGNQHLRIKNSHTTINPALVESEQSNLASASSPTPALTKAKQITSNYIGKVQLGADSVTPVFKNVGDNVAVGDMVAVVAQLGRLLPVKSEQAGVITEILVENNQRVEYGTPLFTLA